MTAYSIPPLWPALPLNRRGLLFLGVLAAHGGLLAWALTARAPALATMVPLPVSVRLISDTPVAKPLPVTPPVPQPPRAVKSPQPRMPIPTPLAPAPILAAAPAAKVSSDFAVAEPRPAVAAPVAAPAPSQTQARFDADYLHNPKPVYPPLSRRLGEEGKVLLKVSVNAQGMAEQVELHKSSGFNRLDLAARDAVQRWRFVPARRGDEPVAATVLVPITFALEG